MTWIFASSHAVDVLLAFVVLEGVWLIARGRPISSMLLMLLPAVLTLMALREALTGLHWYWIAVP